MRQTIFTALFSLVLLSACSTSNLPSVYRQLSAQPMQNRPMLTRMAQPARAVTTISVTEAHKWLADPNASWKILDVRTPQEFAQGRIQGADNLDFYLGDFKAQLERMDRNQPMILYCRSGSRSGKTLAIMRELGFRNVYEIQGGILAWQAAGYPLAQ
ncbi:MAG: hypothetical protein CVV27_17875 [Candidatus Melainabacteria bacterium HGW-Melainabacteria-1]|nr:MAG: hypothetical protein CVV27_17875 [Candidatus Melainabacteria bacterium HGW-Melainabacteria-1]